MSPGLALVDVPDGLRVDAELEADHPWAHALIKQRADLPDLFLVELSPRIVDPRGTSRPRRRRKSGAIDSLKEIRVSVVRPRLRAFEQVPWVNARLLAARVQDHPSRSTAVLDQKHVPVGHDDTAAEPEDAVAAIVHRAQPVPTLIVAARRDQIAEPREG
jgi:hypothetical protein